MLHQCSIGDMLSTVQPETARCIHANLAFTEDHRGDTLAPALDPEGCQEAVKPVFALRTTGRGEPKMLRSGKRLAMRNGELEPIDEFVHRASPEEVIRTCNQVTGSPTQGRDKQ